VKGKDSTMPTPVHRFRPLIEFNNLAHKDSD
jgi:hypothetical protein